MRELIIGYDHAEKRQFRQHGNCINEMLYSAWPNGWPTDEKEVSIFLEENHEVNNGDMVWGCKTKQDVLDMLVFNIADPVVDISLFDCNGRIENLAIIKHVNDIHDEKYIYPFTVHGSAFIQLKYFRENGLQLSEKVKEDCRKGTCKILMHEFLEGHGFNMTWVWRFIHHQAELLSIPVDSFIFADSNYLTPALQESYGTKGFYKFWWERHNSFLTDSEYDRRVVDVKDPSRKPYYFICLNRRFRWHRTKIILEIFKRWGNKFLWSYDKPPINKELFTNKELAHFSFEEMLVKSGDFPLELYNILPKQIDIDHGVNDTMTRLNLQEQAHISVVTETMFNEVETLFFSEKVYKPIVSLQPFILIGSYNSLKILREQGYKTFHPYINESYDSIESHVARFDAIVHEIDRLSRLPESDIIELVKKCSDICIYNYNHWKTVNESKLRDITFLEKIREWLYAD